MILRDGLILNLLTIILTQDRSKGRDGIRFIEVGIRESELS